MNNKWSRSAVALAILAVLAATFWERLLVYLPGPSYSVRILSYDPVMIHIEDFISRPERAYLLRLGESRFRKSVVAWPNGTRTLDPIRTSSSAYLPNGDPIVERIIARAAEFQGFTPRDAHEGLQLTRYREGEKYNAHWDFLKKDVPSDGTERISTFFVFLKATCEECGTQFPDIRVDWGAEDKRWCKLINCQDHENLVVKPIPGNAIFWRNVDVNGVGDRRTLHAGLPPETGIKTGLNIWTRG